MKMFVAGHWVDKPRVIEVKNPYDGALIDTVPRGDGADVERALACAEQGAKFMAKLSAYERWKILRKTADWIAARTEELGQVISKEEEGTRNQRSCGSPGGAFGLVVSWPGAVRCSRKSTFHKLFAPTRSPSLFAIKSRAVPKRPHLSPGWRTTSAERTPSLGWSFRSCYSPFANVAKALLQPCQFAVPLKPVDCRM